MCFYLGMFWNVNAYTSTLWGGGRVGLMFCLQSDSVIIILSVERFDEAAIKRILDNVVALLEVDEPEGKAKVLMLIAEIAKSGNSERNKSS